MADPELQEPNIIAENVQVRYTVNTNDPGNRAKGLRRIANAVSGRHGQTTVRALRGVNFVAREGEMVGIVGANGSGKSTFLRNVAGVEQPDRGRILVRFQPLLLGVSAALQPALSGSENVRLGCLAMGLSPEEATDAFDRVVELSALGAAIHRPMGTYSSGMGAQAEVCNRIGCTTEDPAHRRSLVDRRCDLRRAQRTRNGRTVGRGWHRSLGQPRSESDSGTVHPSGVDAQG